MRFRLTVGAVLATVILVVLGVGFTDVLLGRQLTDHVQEDVLGELAQFEEMLPELAGDEELLAFTREYLVRPESDSLRRRGMVFTLFLNRGPVLSNDVDFDLETLDQSGPLVRQGEPVLGVVERGAQDYLLAGRPLVLGSETIGGVELAAPLAPVRDIQRQVLFVLILTAALATIIIGLGFWFLIGKTLEPVRRMTGTAAEISREDLSRRIAYQGPPDELGELAGTLNGMLARLESAFGAQDRFISDVSHELRTPLTIIKGHLQVLDREVDPDPALVKKEHALVLDELDRMNRLVEELLTLARLQRTDVLEWGSVDLDNLLSTLTSQGEHLGKRLWAVDQLPGVTIQADQDRLTQAFLNLMQNAVRHTDPDTPIALGGAVADGHVRLWVRDEGAGMAPEVRERVTERFFHGPLQDGAGLGLGLAIVAGIAEAHGGKLEIESELGKGSTVTLVLPHGETRRSRSRGRPAAHRARGEG